MGEIFWNAYGAPNSPPAISDTLPVLSDENADVEVSFRIGDLQSNVDLATLEVVFTFDPLGSPVAVDVISAGAFQPGYNGTIVANGIGGYDVAISTHPDFVEGDYQADVSVQDDVGEEGTAQWTWGVVTRATLLSVQAVGRHELELTFDMPVRLRAEELLLQEPSDRYTPVDWIALGGEIGDAANPANYTITRPVSGNLTGAGEAIPLDVVYAYAPEGSWYVSASVVWTEVVRVQTDYQQTARASYSLNVQNVSNENGAGIREVDVAFTGYIVSHVERFSLHLWDLVSGVHQRDDTDGTGDLVRFLTALQEVLDRLLEDVDAFVLELVDIDQAREDFLDNLLYDLGDPFQGVFSLTTAKKRRLAAILVQIYKEKGTCQGIINAVNFFLEVTLSGCLEPYDGAWRLAGGSYPSPTGPDQDELNIDTLLAPAPGEETLSFRLVSPVVLSTEEKAQIREIAQYMKPANTIYRGIIEP